MTSIWTKCSPQRERINTVLRERLDAETERWGIKVTNVEIREIEPPRDIQDAMNRQMSAERIRRAVVREAEGTREAAVTVAEGEKQAAILKAEGQRQAEILTAEATSRRRFSGRTASPTLSTAYTASPETSTRIR